MPAPTKRDRDEFAASVADLLRSAQEAGLPVHIGTSRSSWIHVGFLVRTVVNGDGRCELVNTQNGEPFTPKLTEISLAAAIDGRCVSRPARKTRAGDRRRDVATAMSGLGSLLAEPDLSAEERSRLERLVGELASLSA